MKRRLLNFWKLLKTAFKQWNLKDPFRESAIIAYYAIFSLPGLLVVIITLAGYFFGKSEVSEYMSDQIAAAMSADTAKQIQVVIDKAYDENQSVIATIIGIATILLGATGVFIQLQKSLNYIWEVKADASKSGIMQLLRARLFSLGLIITIAFLLLISLVITTLLSAFSGYIQSRLPDYMMFLFEAINFIFSLAIITLLFAMMFKFMPDAQIKWNTVWIGSILTALLFVLGKSALGFYFGKANPGSGYGAAGYIILILLWTSYSSMIVFYGAEFTKAFSDMKYGDTEPSKHAVKDEKAEFEKKIEEKRVQEKEQQKRKKKSKRPNN
ncbi:MAG TPA: YihY/virulence factor BrkB family protein [Lentimicrobium sp.]|nr:YihY/virulence factor BrkB family protein [Lentimicrobium sp.]